MGMASLRRYKKENLSTLKDCTPVKEEKKEPVKKPKQTKKKV